MAREKIISSESGGVEDEQFNMALRPQTLADCIGTGDLLEKLKISIAAADRAAASLYAEANPVFLAKFYSEDFC